MKLTLPWGTMPDIIFHLDYLYVARSSDAGLPVGRFDTFNCNYLELFHEPETFGISWQKFAIYNGSVHMAYKIQPSQLLRVVKFNPYAVNVPVTQLGCWGNDPFCWDLYTEGLLSVQVPMGPSVEDVELWQGDIIGGAGNFAFTGLKGPQYTNGLGLAHSAFGDTRLRNDLHIPDMTNPVLAQNDPTIIVGQGLAGGIRIIDGNKEGTLIVEGGPAVYTGNPRATRMPNGEIAVVYWQPKEFGNGLTVITNININDIVDLPPPVNVPPFSRPKAVGSYFCTSVQYGDFVVPGNFEMLLNGEDYNRMKVKRPVIAGLTALNVPSNQLMGYLANNVQDINAIRFRPNKKAFMYTDSQAANSFEQYRQYMQPGDVLMVQAYLNNGEGLMTFRDRIAEAVTYNFLHFPNQHTMLVCGVSDRGFHSDLTLQNLMVVHQQMVHWNEVQGVAFFSYGRPTGVISHPSLFPWVQAFNDASTGIPAPLQPPVATDNKPPKVNITRWDKELTANNYWRADIADGNNPSFVVVVEFENGSLHVRMTNAFGTDKSGLKRVVNIH